MARAALLVIVCSALSGCRCDGGQAGPPPVAAATVDAAPELRVPLELDGREIAVIDRALLDATPPHSEGGGRRVWRLRSLVGDGHAGRTTQVEVERSGGARDTYPPSEEAGGREPLVWIGAGGELEIGFARADRPLAPASEAPGAGVRRIVLHARDAGRDAPPDFRLTVTFEGEGDALWVRADLGQVATVDFSTDDGEEQREAWSLRDIARTLVGAGAVVLEVAGEGGRRVPITPAQWADATRVPVLRSNRRGLLKFQWLGAGGAPIETGGAWSGVRGVTALVIRKPG